MKTRFHRWLLGLMLLLLMPGTALACLLLFGVIVSGVNDGFRARNLSAIGMLLTAPGLFAWGFRIMRGLRFGFHASLRRWLLAFYLAVFAYCGLFLVSTFSIFSPIVQIVGFGILIVPVLITLFSKPEPKRDTAPPPMGERNAISLATDRFVSWLSAKIR